MTEHTLDLAARVVDLVRGAAGPAAQAEVCVAHRMLSLTRFANSYIHQNVADDTVGVRLRVHVDGRTATGSSTVLTVDGLADLVGRTVAAARLAPPDPGWPGLAPPVAAPAGGGLDPATAAATPAERAERVRSFVDAAGGLEAAGYVRTQRWVGAFANSAGQSGVGESTEAAMDGIARAGGADGVARLAATALSDLDGAVLGARAAAKARAAAADPVELPPGRYEVVLEPAAVADVLANLAAWGFSGKAYAERRSFATPGEPQFDGAVTLVDNPVGGRGFSLPFDAEGTPRRRLVLGDAGTTRAVAHDRRTAAAVGAESTGHAVVGGRPWGPFPLDLRLEPVPDGAASGRSGAEPAIKRPRPAAGPDGAATEVDGPMADSSVAALASRVERGVLVTDLWYTRVLDTKTLVVTGLTRNGVWLVEGGEVTRPLRNFRFTQSYPRALAPGAVLGVGRHADAQPEGRVAARWTAPALHLASWNFTGGASG
jgi:predicted Zn-dependent protease